MNRATLPVRFALVAFLLCALVLFVQADPSPPAADAKSAADIIDKFLTARQTDANVKAVGRSSDAEFLRRVYLDLAGKIPSVQECHEFLDDQRPNKRELLIDDLLKRPSYVSHFTNVWRAWWLPSMNTDFENPALRQSFEAWLRARLSENATYDQMVREIVTLRAPGNRGIRELGVSGRGQAMNTGVSPTAFYQVLENKAENLGSATSRLFLGTKLECAQCHNHPFATWSREQFWQYAAFFTGLENNRPKREITIPSTKQVVQARYLDDTVPEFKQGVNPRVTLADWMTAKDNKFFARAAVNRLWAHFMGTGLNEPVDDLREGADGKELLDELAHQFAANNYDLKFLIRSLVLSDAYQRTSARPAGEKGAEVTDEEQAPLFDRMQVRGLSPEQLFDSLVEATRYQSTDLPRVRAEFLAKFNNPTERATELQTSILQALTLMNGKLVGSATGMSSSKTLEAVADSPFLDTPKKIDALYLAALCRKATPAERDRLVAYVDKGGPSGDSKQALADVFWAVLNSSEFMFNH